MLGAYAAVLAVNAYVYTSLSYITLNVLKRFLNDNFSAAFTDVPFQTIGESPTAGRRHGRRRRRAHAAAALTPPVSPPQTSS